jgi:hypothetical protein
MILFTADTRDSSPLHGTRTYFGVILRGKVAGREASSSSSSCSGVKMLRFVPLLPHICHCVLQMGNFNFQLCNELTIVHTEPIMKVICK